MLSFILLNFFLFSGLNRSFNVRYRILLHTVNRCKYTKKYSSAKTRHLHAIYRPAQWEKCPARPAYHPHVALKIRP